MAVSMAKTKFLSSALAFSLVFALGAPHSPAAPVKTHVKAARAPVKGPVTASVKGPAAAPPNSTAGKDEIVVKLHPSDVIREGKIIFTEDFLKHPTFSRPIDEMSRGRMMVDGEEVVFYIPQRGPYPLTTDDEDFHNTSMRISVDANNDGQLENTEAWYSSLPVRMGDTMFQVRSVDPKGAWIKFAKANVPLSGMVVGKPCPDFEFTTSDGQKVRLADYKGKVLLLDVWSMG